QALLLSLSENLQGEIRVRPAGHAEQPRLDGPRQRSDVAAAGHRGLVRRRVRVRMARRRRLIREQARRGRAAALGSQHQEAGDADQGASSDETAAAEQASLGTIGMKLHGTSYVLVAWIGVLLERRTAPEDHTRSRMLGNRMEIPRALHVF